MSQETTDMLETLRSLKSIAQFDSQIASGSPRTPARKRPRVRSQDRNASGSGGGRHPTSGDRCSGFRPDDARPSKGPTATSRQPLAYGPSFC